MEHQSKEAEFQRLWDEGIDLKKVLRGETNECVAKKQENETFHRQIISTKQDIAENQRRYELIQAETQNCKLGLQEFEGKLNYANEIINDLQQENHQIQLTVQQQKS